MFFRLSWERFARLSYKKAAKQFNNAFTPLPNPAKLEGCYRVIKPPAFSEHDGCPVIWRIYPKCVSYPLLRVKLIDAQTLPPVFFGVPDDFLNEGCYAFAGYIRAFSGCPFCVIS